VSKFAGHKPHSDNVFVAFIESAIEAFEAVLAYLANTISFVRLAAYAMSHAAILMATFAMAEAVGETPGCRPGAVRDHRDHRQPDRLGPGRRGGGPSRCCVWNTTSFLASFFGERPAVQALLVSRQGKEGDVMHDTV
jgi:hypothetical protein